MEEEEQILITDEKPQLYQRFIDFIWIVWSVVLYIGAIAVIVSYILGKRLIPVKENETKHILVGKDYTIRKAYFGLLLHIIGGTIGLLVGPLQFQQFIRKRTIKTHKVFGYIYYVGMVIGLIGSIWLVPFASGGMTNKFAFGILAMVWLVTNSTAFYYIVLCQRYTREVRIQLHREWMIRSYAATTGAITLRIWIFILLTFNLAVLKLQYEEAFMEMYRTVSWLGFVPNMIVAEVYIRMVYDNRIQNEMKIQ
jgi:hypothetical protein